MNIGLIILATGILGALYVSLTEHQEYNSGFHKEDSGRWTHFDTDSQGGKGWECEKCGTYMWTSWVRTKEPK